MTVNWTGTATSANSTGTLTGADATTATNTGASWPTGGTGLSNFHIRILTGPGASSTPVLIASNTATILTLGAAWPAGTPNNTSTYEIVLILKNGDHITGSIYLSTSIITELEDSATIYIDGNYNFKMNSTSCVLRWAKTPSTLVTFQPNNRTTAGTIGFWTYMWLSAAFVVPPQVSYIKVLDANYGFTVDANCDLSNVHHIWYEGIGADTGFNAGAMTANQKYRNFYIKGDVSTLTFGCTGSYTASYENCWTDWISGAIWNASGCTGQKVRNCVFLHGSAQGYVNAGATQTYSIEDSYLTPGQIFFQRLIGCSSSAAAGNYKLLRNTITSARCIYSASSSSATTTSNFNDIAPSHVLGNSYSYTDVQASGFAAFTSDNDFISGTAGASPGNIDTTQGMKTSNATPAQYKNLTANRTNAKSVRNRPLTMDNVVVGTPTTTSVTITFDCTNGAVAGQGSSTVDANSASGQAVLSIADTTGFSIGEIVEIGYGTARSETFEILSISAGDTITGTTNLVYAHTSAQADTVTKQLRHTALPYVCYGLVSGVCTNRSNIPDREYWGPLFTGIMTAVGGVTYTWAKTGHSVTLSGLQPGTKYYFKCKGTNPIDETLTSTEGDFTTAGLNQSFFFV